MTVQPCSCRQAGLLRPSPSRAARYFVQLAQQLEPVPMHAALSDNGSGFQGHFAQALDEAGIVQWQTYPKTPEMSTLVERFNQNIQEDFVDYHEDLLFTDLVAFNDQLAEWLKYYNTVRPHQALHKQTQASYLLNLMAGAPILPPVSKVLI